jgi:hypothetical protein
MPRHRNPTPWYLEHKPITRDEQHRDLRRELRTASRELAEITPAQDYFRSPPPPGAGTPFAVAEEIFGFAAGMSETAEHPRSDPPAFAGKAFLRKVGLPGVDPDAVSWTADLIEPVPQGVALG